MNPADVSTRQLFKMLGHKIYVAWQSLGEAINELTQEEVQKGKKAAAKTKEEKNRPAPVLFGMGSEEDEEENPRQLPYEVRSETIPNLKITHTGMGLIIPRFNLFGAKQLPNFRATRMLFRHFYAHPRDVKLSYPLTEKPDGVTYGTDYLGFAHDLLQINPGLVITKSYDGKGMGVVQEFMKQLLATDKVALGGLHVDLPQYMRTYIDFFYNQPNESLEKLLLPDKGEWFRSDGTKERLLWRDFDDVLAWRDAYTPVMVKKFMLDESICDVIKQAFINQIHIFCMGRFSDILGHPDHPKGATRIGSGAPVREDEYLIEQYLHGNHFRQQVVRYNNMMVMGLDRKFIVYTDSMHVLSGNINGMESPGIGAKIDVPTLVFIPSKRPEVWGIYKTGALTYFMIIPSENKVEQPAEVAETALKDIKQRALENNRRRMIEDQRNAALRGIEIPAAARR